MTYEEIRTLVESIGLPWDYYQFDEDTEQEPPYIAYFLVGSHDKYADNSNYQRIETLTIELYSEDKDYEDEAAIEAALNRAGLTFARAEEQIDSEKLYMVIYQADVLIVEDEESE